MTQLPSAVASLGCVVVAISAFLLSRDILFPPVLVAGVWGLVLMSVASVGDKVPVIGADTALLFLAGVCSFCLGSIATGQMRAVRPSDISIRRPLNVGRTRQLVVLSAIGLPAFLYSAYRLAHDGPTSNLLINLRIALTVDGADLGPAKYLVPVSFVAAAATTACVGSKQLSGKWLALAYMTGCCYAFGSTGRGFFVLLAVGCGGVAAIRGQISLRKLSIIGLISISIVWVGLALILGKGLSASSSAAENASSFGENLVVYLTGSIPAFQTVMDASRAPMLGSLTGRTVLAAARAAGMDVDVPAMVRPFVYVPFATNVYTVCEPYYRDFLAYGVVVAQFLFGSWHGLAYHRARLGHSSHQIIYGFALFPALTQFFQDNYFSLLSLWIQLTILSIFLGSRPANEVRYERN